MQRSDYVYRGAPTVGAHLRLVREDCEWRVYEWDMILATGPTPGELRRWAWGYPIQELRHDYDCKELENG
jgi:hypothetical protein